MFWHTTKSRLLAGRCEHDFFSKMAKEAKDLIDLIEWPALEVLNLRGDTAPNALKQGYRDQDELVLESDADEQVSSSRG